VGERTLICVDRKGAAQPIPAPSRGYISPRLSPDGQRLAVGIQTANFGVWLYDLARGTLTRLAEAPLFPFPTWTPDGKLLTLSLYRQGSLNLYWMPADGGAAVERLTTSGGLQVLGSWSPNGEVLAFSEMDPTTGWDISVLRLEGDRKPQPFLHTPQRKRADTLARWPLARVSIRRIRPGGDIRAALSRPRREVADFNRGGH